MKPVNFKALLRRTLVVPLLIMGILAGVLLWEAHGLLGSMMALDQTDQVISSSRRLLLLLVDMESGVRGYLVTGNEAFLEPYYSAAPNLDLQYQALYRQVKANPAQQARLEQVRDSYLHWRQYAEQMIALRRTGGAHADNDVNLEGKRQMDEVRRQLDTFNDAEEQLHSQRTLAAQNNWARISASCVILLVGTGFILALLTRAQMRTLAEGFQGSLDMAQQRADRLRRLELVTEAALAHLSLNELLPRMLQRAVDVLPADLALLLLLDEKTQMLETRAGIGWVEEIEKRRRVPFGQGIAGTIAQSGQLRIIDNLQEAELFNPILRQRASSLIGVPLVVEHRVIGVILVCSRKKRKFTQDEAGLLQIVADRIALSIDRKRAEEELAGVAQRYRSLFDNLAEGLAHCQVIYNEAGNAVDFVPLDVNDAFGKLTSLAEVIGKRITEVVPGIREANPKLFTICGRVASSGLPERFDFELKPRGTWFSISVYSTRLGEFVALFDNITQRKRAEEALRTSEERWATTLQSIADAVISTDSEGRVVFMNEVAQNLTGWTWGEAKGSPLHRIFHLVQEVTRIRPEDPVSKVLRLGKVVGLANHSLLVRRDGSEVPIEDAAAPIRDPAKENQIEGVVLVFRDVSIQRRAEQAVRNSERLATTGRLAATIAHEIHNPLDTVANLLFLMEQETESADVKLKPIETSTGAVPPAIGDREVMIPRLREFLDMASQELSRVTQLTQQMLTFQRDAIRPAPLKIKEILPGVLDLYDRRIKSSGIRFEKEIEFDGEITALPGEMRQVFANLVSNAIDAVATGLGFQLAAFGPQVSTGQRPVMKDGDLRHATADSGRIRLRTHPSREWRTGRAGLRVVLADNGPGIPAGIRDRIFEPFFTTKGENGTGLGLWVTSDIVRKYGGAIRVRTTTRPGRTGTCFSVFLPIHEQSEP